MCISIRYRGRLLTGIDELEAAIGQKPPLHPDFIGRDIDPESCLCVVSISDLEKIMGPLVPDEDGDPMEYVAGDVL